MRSSISRIYCRILGLWRNRESRRASFLARFRRRRYRIRSCWKRRIKCKRKSSWSLLSLNRTLEVMLNWWKLKVTIKKWRQCRMQTQISFHKSKQRRFQRFKRLILKLSWRNRLSSTDWTVSWEHKGLKLCSKTQEKSLSLQFILKRRQSLRIWRFNKFEAFCPN